MDISVNFVSILLAAIASMAIGFLWYSELLFGKTWMKLMGYTKKSLEEDQKKMGPMYGLSFVAALITAYVLAHVMSLSHNFYGYPMLQTALTSAFFVWVGFIAPIQMTDVIFGKKTWKLYFINTFYQLTSVLIMGIVISLF